MSDDKPKTVTLTNNDQGPRFVFTTSGSEVVPAGSTVTVQMNAAQVRATRSDVIENTDPAVERWTIEGGDDDDLGNGPVDNDGLRALPIAKLRALAQAEGVPLTGRVDDQNNPLPDLSSKDDIVAAIVANRAKA